MAQCGPGSASENSSHPAPLAAELLPSHRINAANDRVQAADTQPMLDGTLRESELHQLLTRNHSMLPPG
jgi:hypothetical protein